MINHVVLQELREELVLTLKVLFERSLCIISGTQPTSYPLFKKGEKSAAANYRPISLACILCKVMEYINVVKYLNSDGPMYD